MASSLSSQIFHLSYLLGVSKESATTLGEITASSSASDGLKHTALAIAQSALQVIATCTWPHGFILMAFSHTLVYDNASKQLWDLAFCYLNNVAENLVSSTCMYKNKYLLCKSVGQGCSQIVILKKKPDSLHCIRAI